MFALPIVTMVTRWYALGYEAEDLHPGGQAKNGCRCTCGPLRGRVRRGPWQGTLSWGASGVGSASVLRVAANNEGCGVPHRGPTEATQGTAPLPRVAPVRLGQALVVEEKPEVPSE